MKKTTLAALLGLLALTGCDNVQSPAGAGADATESTSTSRTSATTGTTELASSKEQVITAEMPLLPLLGAAAQELALLPDDLWSMWTVHCQAARGYIDLESIRETTPPERHFLIDADQDAQCAAYSIMITMRPVHGWPFGLHAPEWERKQYMNDETANLLAVTDLLTVVAQDVTDKPGLTREEYIELLKDSITKHAAGFSQSLEAQKAIGRSFGMNMAGSVQPVEYRTSDGYSVELGGAGGYVQLHGSPWYGQGYLSGTRYTLEVAQSNAVGYSRSHTTGAAREATTGESSSAAVHTQK